MVKRAATSLDTTFARRLAAQRITAGPLDDPGEVVRALGAIQAQDYLGALWAIGLRTKSAREADVERAIAERHIVRTWPMRGTLHFVAADDARWMVELLAPRPLAGAAGRFRRAGIDSGVLARARRVLVRALEGGRTITRPGAYALLERAKIVTTDQRGLYVLFSLAHERLLCFGPRSGKQPTFVLFDEWLPDARSRPAKKRSASSRFATSRAMARRPSAISSGGSVRRVRIVRLARELRLVDEGVGIGATSTVVSVTARASATGFGELSLLAPHPASEPRSAIDTASFERSASIFLSCRSREARSGVARSVRASQSGFFFLECFVLCVRP